jgi:hypothetical protein
MASAVGSLVTDVILVISMLIGLVRSPHSSTTGLWRLLYQQVVIYLSSVLTTDAPQVLHMVGLGDDRGCSTYGVSISVTL